MTAKQVNWGTIKSKMLDWDEKQQAKEQAIAKLEILAIQGNVSQEQITEVLELLKSNAA
ncbi:MAG: hypothetical protein KME42_28240 [Tildeniella nuda ZEHNDER 1965/U140]|jgi:predicted DNA-binding protein with PD1-like motif|nr:hypothetical protein [Tildeniella nuda ZEHNDER 1965/U140]